MKRIAVLALALALLLASLAAQAEFEEPVPSPISTLTLTNLSFAHLEGGKAKSIPLKQSELTLSTGETAGVPTLQASFDNGKGQEMDFILQVSGNRLLFALSGVSGTYFADLTEAAKDVDAGGRFARGLAEGLALAGPHLDGLLQGLSTVDAKGERTVRFELPRTVCLTIAGKVLKVLKGMDITGTLNVKAIKKALKKAKRAPAIELRYRPADGRLALELSAAGETYLLEADMALATQPSVLVNISADPMMIDLMHLQKKQIRELRGELAIIALKYVGFAGGTGLSRVLN